MRRVKIASLALASFALMGCEDGPNQVFSAAPAGAGDRWNNGNTAPSVDPTRAGFDGKFGGGSKQEICTGEQKAARWSKMVNEPIRPPRFAAGLDFAGGEKWPGLLFPDAEKINCQSDSLGQGSGTLVNSWGDAGEVVVEYNINNLKLSFVSMNTGYKGAIEFKSRPGSRFSQDGEHSYVGVVGKPIMRDGKRVEFSWANSGPDQVKDDALFTELYDALMYTFAPELPSDENNCRTSAKCLARQVGNGEAVFGARGVGFYYHFSYIDKEPNRYQPDYFYIFPVKLLPYSNASMHLKLDQEGPVAFANGLGDRTPKADCKLFLGQRYDQFLHNCVNVLQDPSKNELSYNKLVGNLTHTDENFIFDVVGVNQDFSSERIGQFDVIHDDWLPEPGDVSTEYLMDIRATGPVLNDLNAQGVTDLHGTAAIYREYAREVQNELNSMLPAGVTRHELGDPACLFPDVAEYPPGFDPERWMPAEGCTGFEGMVFPEPRNGLDPEQLEKLKVGRSFGHGTVLRPSDPIVVFCSDPSELVAAPTPDDPGAKALKNPNAYTHCGTGADTVGLYDSLWDGSWRRVVKYLGRGNVNKLPAEARDRKFFFKVWAQAFAKYLMNAPSNPRVLTGPGISELEQDALFFDDLGADNEKFEYIDRRFVDFGHEPLKFEYEALILSGNQRDSKFHRRMTRPERTMYKAMATDKTLAEGSENNVLFTNMVGSPVLRDNWYGVSSEKSAHFCATHVDADCMSVDPLNHAPTDATGQIILDRSGRPLLQPYAGAFGETVFAVGKTHLKVGEKFDLIRSAKVQVPNFLNPYDAAGSEPPISILETLADWRSHKPNIGIAIPINGQRDRFVETDELDFSGTSISLALDYIDELDPVTKQPTGNAHLVGASSNDYLGDVFLCRDPITGDVLDVEPFEAMARVLEWIDAHPGTPQACGLIVRYSPFNNYPSQLISQSAGMYVYVKAGDGFGRVSTVVAYDTTL